MRKLAGRPRLQAVSWLAPECFRGDGLSKHSDVYAFGILMWELYTGQVIAWTSALCGFVTCHGHMLSLYPRSWWLFCTHQCYNDLG
jgi:hypothetical protein